MNNNDTFDEKNGVLNVFFLHIDYIAVMYMILCKNNWGFLRKWL